MAIIKTQGNVRKYFPLFVAIKIKIDLTFEFKIPEVKEVTECNANYVHSLLLAFKVQDLVDQRTAYLSHVMKSHPRNVPFVASKTL